VLFPSAVDVITEAWENYVFEAMVNFDANIMEQLVSFRSSLLVVPPPPGTPDPVQVQARIARTDALWAGYRRVYFGLVEPEPSHDRVMDRLRAEVTALHQRPASARKFQGDGDSSSSSSDDGNSKDGDNWGTGVHDGIGHDFVSNVSLGLSVPAEKEESSTLIAPAAAPVGSSLLRRVVLLSRRTLRRVLAAKESLFKFGTFVPKNDREADSSPEAVRWDAGRTLEWVRLGQQRTFDGDWTWAKVRELFPDYKKADVGFLFYVYDFKFSGEHRVRLVFDGSRQSDSTYSETYAPTVRAESVRLFHIVCVEEGYCIGQYDVPQAFLKADIDHYIFAYPPRGQSAFPGQILKLRRALYGGKQSAFLWFQMMNEFLLKLGFKSSPLDSCDVRMPC
jgi:hypothetical protein